MTVFTIHIEDEKHLEGITAAREAYNNSQDDSAQILTDEEYVQFVMLKAAESYASQYGLSV